MPLHIPAGSHIAGFIDRSARNPAHLRIVFVAILTVIAIGMSLKYAAKVNKPGDSGQQTRSAFLRWRGMIHELFAGGNVYVGVHEYPNPPIMALALKPFADLPPVAGAMAWFYAKVLMAALAAVWIFRLVSGRSNPSPEPGQGTDLARSPPRSAPEAGVGNSQIPDLAKAIAILLALPPILGDLSHNNVNIFILFLIAACLEAYRRGWDVSAGLVLGLAVACKVTPLLFLAYFAWKRAWKVVAGCAVGLVLWLAIVPGAVYGWERNGELLESWYSLMVRPSLVENRVTSEHPNQSIPGVAFRLLTHSPSFLVYPDNIPTPAAFHNVADIGTDNARWTVKGCLVAFGLLIIGLCRGPRSERQGWRFAAECSLIVLGMLLFSERTWKHHAVTLLLPFAVIAASLFASGPSQRLKRWLAGILAAVGLLTIGSGVLPGHAADLAMVYGSYTASFLLLVGAVVVVLIGQRHVD